MRFNEVIKLLEKNGFVWTSSHNKGSCRIYTKGKRVVPIHYHGNKEIKTGTLRAILKEAGIHL